MSDGEAQPRSKHRWVVRGIVGALLICVLGATGLVISHRLWKSRRQAQQRAAMAAVVELGGAVQHSFSSFSPISIMLENGDAPNMILLNSKGVTDDDLRIFESAPTTRALSLFGNQVTDAGLAHLSNLSELDFLDLRRNNITDAGLVHLEGLTKLKNLYLIGTNVTPAGVKKLQQKLPNAKIAH
jgi:hypothetical protein